MFADHMPFEYEENFRKAMETDFPNEFKNENNQTVNVEVNPLHNSTDLPEVFFAEYLEQEDVIIKNLEKSHPTADQEANYDYGDI